jgi:hypothetical protein
MHLCVPTAQLGGYEVSLRFLWLLVALFITHKDPCRGNDEAIDPTNTRLKVPRNIVPWTGLGIRHVCQREKLAVRFPLQTAVCEPADSMAALPSCLNILKAGQIRRQRRATIFSNDSDVPDVGVTIKIQGWPCMKLVMKISSQRVFVLEWHRLPLIRIVREPPQATAFDTSYPAS